MLKFHVSILYTLRDIILLDVTKAWFLFDQFVILVAVQNLRYFSALPETYSIFRIITTTCQKILPSLRITKQFSFFVYVYPTYSYYSSKWVPYFSNTLYMCVCMCVGGLWLREICISHDVIKWDIYLCFRLKILRIF